jgi:outer membrane protein assembly factor BamB
MPTLPPNLFRVVCQAMSFAALAVATAAVGAPARAEEAEVTIGWRGDGTGRYPAARPPLDWSPGTCREVWRTTVGESFSSPVVAGDCCLVASEPDFLVCVDRGTGAIRWRRSTSLLDLPNDQRQKLAGRPPAATACGYTTPTPVSDGERVYVVLGTGLVACYDLAGERLWVQYFDDGRPLPYGRSASPLLVDGRLVVSVFHLRALDPRTGESLWDCTQAKEAHGTPAIARLEGTATAVTTSGDVVRLSDGKLLAANVALAEYATPAVDGTTVYFINALAGAYQLSLAEPDRVRARELWIAELDGQYFGSPVLHGGRIYALSGSGNVEILEAATGERVGARRLMPAVERLVLPPGSSPGEPEAPASFYPSLSLAGEHLFAGNQAGDWWSLAPDRDAVPQGEWALPAGSPGTPAFAGEEVYLRCGDELWCLAPK